MGRFRMTPEEHALVSAAVAEAERGTDGEIVTVVTDLSDGYHDVALQYAVAAMLAVGAVSAALPGVVSWKLDWLTGGAIGWASAEAQLAWTLGFVLLGQVLAFLVVRVLLALDGLRVFLTPPATRARRVRRRAIGLFRAAAQGRTRARVGVLLYLSMREHRAEIVADEAIHSRVPAERWGDAMVALVERVRAGEPGAGMAAAVTAIGAIVAEHFPKTAQDPNELPDRLIEL